MDRAAAALLIGAGLSALAAGCSGPAEEGLRAHREGRTAEALRLYAAAAAAAGEGAPAALHANIALAALREGDPAAALRAAEEAARRAGEGTAAAAEAAFLRGCAAAALGAAAEREAAAAGPVPDPRARTRAATLFEDALLSFSRAAADLPDGAVARRNAERALLALERKRCISVQYNLRETTPDYSFEYILFPLPFYIKQSFCPSSEQLINKMKTLPVYF